MERQWSIFEGNERETHEGQERIRGEGRGAEGRK